MKQFLHLSTRIYDQERFNYWRKMVFFIRTVAHHKQMIKLIAFFEKHPLRREIATAQPCIFEQATRQWFYRQSNFSERTQIIKQHYQLLNDRFTENAVRRIYLDGGLLLWSQEYQNEKLSLSLKFSRGSHEKEGLMALLLKLGEKRIYQLIFWLTPGPKNEPALWIGALQGSPKGLDISRNLTKLFHGCRTKNFIFQALHTVVRQTGITKMYAVSNYGFYANNHVRLDRKLKTSLDDFWLEVGGTLCTDKRFFSLPLLQERKSLEEIDSRKRSQYRKRFALLDNVDLTIQHALQPYLVKEKCFQAGI